MSDDQPAALFGLEGRIAVVVGGGQGMGESSALMLARAGCDVAVVDVVAERAAQVADEVAASGQRGAAITADVLDDEAVAGVIAQVEAALGAPDVLVTIVGQASFEPLLSMSADTWELDHRRNLRYVFGLGQAFANALIGRGAPGAMVCIASVSGLQASPLHAAYGAAKAGLVNLTQTMAAEWAQYGIRVNAVAPGTITTPRLGDTPEIHAFVQASNIPMKRSGTSDEVGAAVLFLASELAGYITGHTLAVDGGWMAANLLGMPPSR